MATLLEMSQRLQCSVGSDVDQLLCSEFSGQTIFPDRITHQISLVIHPELAKYEPIIDRAVNTTINLARRQGRVFDGEIFHRPGIVFIGWSHATTELGSHFAHDNVSSADGSELAMCAMAFGPDDISEDVVFHEATHMAERLFLTCLDDVSTSRFPSEKTHPILSGDYSFVGYVRWQVIYWKQDVEEYWVNQCYRLFRGYEKHTDHQILMRTHTVISNYAAELLNAGMPRKEIQKLVKDVIFNQAHPKDIRFLREDITRRLKGTGLRF